VTLVEQTLDARWIERQPLRLIGDAAYDSDRLDERLLEERGIELIAPNRPNRWVSGWPRFAPLQTTLENRTSFRLVAKQPPHRQSLRLLSGTFSRLYSFGLHPHVAQIRLELILG